jgi:hypothetical protein
MRLNIRAFHFCGVIVVLLIAITFIAGATRSTQKLEQSKETKQDPPGTISGAANPSAIPEWAAYELFLRSVAAGIDASAVDRKRAEGLAKKTGLRDSEVPLLTIAAEEFKRKISVLDQQANAIKNRNWPKPTSQDMAELADLQSQREALVSSTVDSLTDRLDRLDGTASQKLTLHINEKIKKRMKKIPSQLPKKHH